MFATITSLPRGFGFGYFKMSEESIAKKKFSFTLLLI